MTADRQASMTFRLPADLHAAFVAACRARDRSAAQELRAFMRQYVELYPADLPSD